MVVTLEYLAGAFDSVSHSRLPHNLRKRKIPVWIIGWVKSFLTGRQTTLAIYRQTTEAYRHSSRISCITYFVSYLFYNADLLDLCERPGTRVKNRGYC